MKESIFLFDLVILIDFLKMNLILKSPSDTKTLNTSAAKFCIFFLQKMSRHEDVRQRRHHLRRRPRHPRRSPSPSSSGTNVIKLFTSVRTKLECMSLAGLSSLV
jgi:hypothetical protein